MLLDQIIFEGEGFFLVVYDDELNFRDLANQRSGFRILPAGFQEVRSDAVAPDARLSHVQDLAHRVLKQVDARLLGEICGFFAEFHRNVYKRATIDRSSTRRLYLGFVQL